MEKTAVQSWSGRSDEIAVPLLGAEFWKVGTRVAGVLEGKRDQEVGGAAFKIALDVPVVIDGVEESVVELPSLTGIKNSLEALKRKGYQMRKGDLWAVECVGIKKAKKEEFSDSPQFQVDVIRKPVAAA